MKTLNTADFMQQGPTLLHSVVNQLGQTVDFYEHPTLGDSTVVIGMIEEVVFPTDFYDTNDFYPDSEYNYCLTESGQVLCYYEITDEFIKLP